MNGLNLAVNELTKKQPILLLYLYCNPIIIFFRDVLPRQGGSGMKTLRVLLILASYALCAQPKAGKRSAEAHEHGSAKLDIAMDGLTGKMVWEVPLESLTGFEHEAKSAADKKKVAAAQAAIREKLGQMVLFPPATGCKVSVMEVEVEQHGEHSEMHTQATVICKQALKGEVRFAFNKFFAGVHKVTVQFVSDTAQTGVQVENDRGTLAIGK
jgi:hypothetical protein